MPPTTEKSCAGSTNSMSPKHSRSITSRLRLPMSAQDLLVRLARGPPAAPATPRRCSISSRGMPCGDRGELARRAPRRAISALDEAVARVGVVVARRPAGCRIDLIWIDLRPAVMSARRSTQRGVELRVDLADDRAALVDRRHRDLDRGDARVRDDLRVQLARDLGHQDHDVVGWPRAAARATSAAASRPHSRSASDENDASPAGASISAYSSTSPTLFCVEQQALERRQHLVGRALRRAAPRRPRSCPPSSRTGSRSRRCSG